VASKQESNDKKSTAAKTTKAKVSQKKVAKKKAVTKNVTKKRVVKKAVAKNNASATISPRERYEMIATMAYYRAEQRNFEPGHDVEDWLDCESTIDSMLEKSK
jgi:cell wall-associated NlpC family hydrolase